jgi:hypothetical protein
MKLSKHSGLARGARIAVAAAAFVAATAGHAAGTPIVVAAPDFTGSVVVTDPTYSETVATFDFAPVAVGDIDSFTISGAWGNSSQGPGSLYGSANDSLFANGVEVATCHSWDDCWGNGNGPVSWSFTVDASQYAAMDGHIDLVAQAGPDYDGFVYGVNVLSDMQATITPVPEPAPLALLIAGLGVVAILSRRRQL